MAAREGRATQGTPLPSGVEFAIFVSSGGAFDDGKKNFREWLAERRNGRLIERH